MTTVRIVWVDDEADSLGPFADGLLEFGFEIELVHPAVPDLTERLEHADGYIADLRWTLGMPSEPSDGPRPTFPNAKRFVQRISSKSPNRPILLYSNFFAQSEYVNIEREFNPAVSSVRLDKSSRGLIGRTKSILWKEVKFEEVAEGLSQLMRQERSRGDVPSLQFDDPRAREVFSTTLAEYQSLPPDKQLALVREGSQLLSDRVDEIFDQSRAEWLVVCGAQPAVVLWGERSDVVTNDELGDIATRYGALPFVFTRPDPVS